MPNTFTLIASSTVGSGGAASIGFSSIPSTYTDLQLVVSARTNYGTAADQILLTLNGSASSFNCKLVYGSGSTVASAALSTNYIGTNENLDLTANTFGSMTVYIPNYAGSGYKTISADSVQENNASNAYAVLNASLWSNTAAINALTVAPNSGGSWVQYSTAYLYGIKSS